MSASPTTTTSSDDELTGTALVSTLLASDPDSAASLFCRVLASLEPKKSTHGGAGPAASTAASHTHSHEPSRLGFATAALSCKSRPGMARHPAVVRHLVRWLAPGLPCGLSCAVLACGALLQGWRDEGAWPLALAEALVRDLAEGPANHRWSDHAECRDFAANLRTACNPR